MYFYTFKQCFMLMNLVGVNPEKKNDKTQIILYILTVLGGISLFYLGILALIHKEDKVTMDDIITGLTSWCLQVHAITKLSIIFFQRSKLLALIKTLHKESWNIADFDNNQEFIDSLKLLKHTYQFQTILTLMCSATCYLQEYLTDGRQIESNLPFMTYWPQVIPFHALLIYEYIVGFALVIPIFCLDVMLFSLLSLTEIQFRLLNRELTNIFQGPNYVNGDIIATRMKSCNDHLTFLLREMMNDTFTHAMLIYMVLIIPILCIQMFVVSTELTKLLTACTKVNGIDIRDILNISLMLLGKAQTKVTVSGGGIVDIDLKTGMDAVKTMISYCMFLRTMRTSN